MAYQTNLDGMNRAEVIGLRARLLSDDSFKTALVNGEADARLALNGISEFLVQNGGGHLTTDELHVTGYELPQEPVDITTRTALVERRAGLINDPAFAAKIIDNDPDAVAELNRVNEALHHTGGGTLSADELKAGHKEKII